MWALRFLYRLHSVLTGSKYSTRPVEFFLAWCTLTWSIRVALPGDVLTSPAFRYFTAAAPELIWGLGGIVIGVVRLIGLVRNGSWALSPHWRLLGAAAGYCWWFSLFIMYTWAVQEGASDFPMRWMLAVFVYFELAACFSCGKDIELAALAKKQTNPLPRSESELHVTR